MNPEIERLIKLAIADGEITDKERGVILRKAEKLGEDIDEVEMILNGELALLKKTIENSNPINQESTKEGVVKKCPSCGASVPSFSTKCSDCGHEFRQADAAKAVTELFEELRKIENEERNRPRNKLGFWQGGQALSDLNLETAIANRQATIISSFPLSNTKEDILEFLSMASSEIVNKPSALEKIRREPRVIKWQAWDSKCKQVIMKARFSFKSDSSTLNKIEEYAKRLKIK